MKILLPVDASSAALAPIPRIATLGRRHADVDVLLLNVQPRFHRHIAQFVGRAALDALRAERSSDAMAKAIEQLSAAGVRFEVLTRLGEAAACIAAVAEREAVDQIVMGVRRRAAWTRALLPSVARGVMARTDIPVALCVQPALMRSEAMSSGSTPSASAAA